MARLKIMIPIDIVGVVDISILTFSLTLQRYEDEKRLYLWFSSGDKSKPFRRALEKFKFSKYAMIE